MEHNIRKAAWGSAIAAAVITGAFIIWPGSSNPQTNRFPDHITAEQHYDSCQLGIFQLGMAKLDLERKLSLCLGQPAPHPDIGTSPPGRNVGFGNGMLWKPVADGGRPPVFVMASKYCAPSGKGMRVSIYDKNGVLRENNLNYTGCANGNRPNHRSGRRAAEWLPHSPLSLRWTVPGGGPEYVIVVNPTKRYE